VEEQQRLLYREGALADQRASDAHTANDMTQWGAPPPEQVIAHTNLYWNFQSAPGRTAGTVKTADVTFTS
jgi:hypothetical protein